MNDETREKNKKEQEDIINKIKITENERDKLIDRLMELEEKEFEEDESLTKILCIACNGKGFIKEDKRKIVCRICKGKRYIWAKKWDDNS
jgi:predicted transcriptional regulator